MASDTAAALAQHEHNQRVVADTRFRPGADARRYKGGRPPTPRVTLPDGQKRTLTELARLATYDSITCLHRCVKDEAEEMSVRCRAAAYLLSLGWGAAPKEATLRLVTNNDAASLSDGELLAIVLRPPEPVGHRSLPEAVEIVQDIEE